MAKQSTNAKTPAESRDDDLERLRRHLDFLGLTHTLGALDETLAWALRERPGPTALLERVLGAEAARKLEKRVARRIEGSGLREHKSLEAFDWAFQPGLDKASITELAQLDFVRRRDDLVITGKSGTAARTAARPDESGRQRSRSSDARG